MNSKCTITDKILQIIPANGWNVELDVITPGGKERISSPLICWALCEDADDGTYIVGVEADDDGLIDTTDSDMFHGYTRETKS